MTGLVRKATLFTFCGLFVAGAAMAGVPNGSTSTIAGNIILVGTGSGPDPAGAFSITVRDLASNPVPGSTVSIDFTGCTDLRIGDQASQMAGITVTGCVVSAVTNAFGVAAFNIVGGATNSDAAHQSITSAQHCATVTASPGNVSIGDIAVVGALNQDGSLGLTGVNGGDLSRWLSDKLNPPSPGQYFQRDDYVAPFGPGPPFGVDGNDLSFLVTKILQGLSAHGPTSWACHP